MTSATIIQLFPPVGKPESGGHAFPPCPRSQGVIERRAFGSAIERALGDVDHLAASALIGDENAVEALKAYSEKVFELACKAKMLVQIVEARK